MNNYIISSAIAISLILWAIINKVRIKNIYKGLIKEQKDSLSPEALNDQWWLDKTHVYITTIFGNHTISLALPMYGTYYVLEPDLNKAKVSADRLSSLFDTYTDMIDKGMYYKRNFLGNFSDPQIALGLFGLITSILLSVSEMYYNNGYSAGQSFTECKLFDCEKGKVVLKDSLSSITVKRGEDANDNSCVEKRNKDSVTNIRHH